MNIKSDKEKLTETLTHLGIGYNQTNNNIVLEELCSNVDACIGFASEFIFDDNGKFIKVIIGEA